MAQPVAIEPNVEDNPPMLRFENAAELDKRLTEITGRNQYRNVIKGYVRAYGDIKCEVPVRVKWFRVTPKTVQKEVTRPIEKMVKRVNSETKEEYYEKIVQNETSIVEDVEFIYEDTWPWFDTLKERLRNKKISEDYYNYCLRAFKKWEENGEIPVDGIPIAEWAMMPEAIKKRCIEIGINTVERLAEANDDTLAQIGMGAREFKNKANAYLNADTSRNRAAALIISAQEEAERAKRQKDELVGVVSQLQAKIAKLEALAEQDNDDADESADSTKRRGRRHKPSDE